MNLTRCSPRLAKKNKAALIPFILEGVGGVRQLNLPDGIHPTAKGIKLSRKMFGRCCSRCYDHLIADDVKLIRLCFTRPCALYRSRRPLCYRRSFCSPRRDKTKRVAEALADTEGVSEVYSVGRFDLAAIVRASTMINSRILSPNIFGIAGYYRFRDAHRFSRLFTT